MSRYSRSGVFSLLTVGLVLALLGGLLSGDQTYAALIYWDPDGDDSNNSLMTGAGLGYSVSGTNTWNADNANWWTGSGADSVWTGGSDTAVLWGPAGLLSVDGTQTLGGL